MFILKIFDAEESIVPPIRDRIILRDNKQNSNSFEIELRCLFLKNLNLSNRDSLNFIPDLSKYTTLLYILFLFMVF